VISLDRKTFSTLTVRVTKEIRAPREVVFDAWLSAESRRKWWETGRPEGLHHCMIDPRIGGVYCMKQIGSPDRPEGFDPDYEWIMEGQFVEITRPRRIVFTWNVNHIPPERDGLVTLDFDEIPGGTRVTLLHENLPTQKIRDDTESGWKQMLAGVQKFLET
jgi:uncharacterized protein YndB with AHSA1/START domain